MTSSWKASKGVGVSLGAALLLIGALVASGCGSSSGSSGGGKIAIVGYSTPQSVYEDSFEAGFQKTPEGSGVTFTNSFGASGDQSRAVAAGQEADVVTFALATDMTRLVDEGQVAPDWEDNRYHGIACDSVVVIAVRKGNPEGIRSFDDLLTKDVDIITPNPASSGSARWNIMAVYGSQLEQGKSPAQALAAVKTVLTKTIAQPGSARDATAAFTRGQGDVLLAYENEAIKAQDEGEEIEYIVPESTIQIEIPIATTKSAPAVSKKFLDYVWSEEGQKIWPENGYRPVDKSFLDPQEFPTPKGLFTIAKFGGWEKVKEEFFEEGSGSIVKIEEELGVPTSG
jgi:sulfate transport system substrate-binding protein